MPENLTDTSTFVDPIVVPADADPLNRTYVVQSAQGLADRTRYLLNRGANGLMLGAGTITCTDGATIHVSPADVLALAGQYAAGAFATYAPTGLSANTFYYLYAFINAGAVALEHSTTAPDAAGIFKAGDATRRYVCSFHTYELSVRIREFTCCAGEYQYRFSAMDTSEGGTGGPFALVNSNAAQVGYANLDLNALVPPNAAFVDVLVTLSQGDGVGAATLGLKPSGDSTGMFSIVGAPSAQDQRTTPCRVPVGTFSGTHRGIAYTYGPGTASVTALVFVTGYKEATR
jgi:hypothetical protein